MTIFCNIEGCNKPAMNFYLTWYKNLFAYCDGHMSGFINRASYCGWMKLSLSEYLMYLTMSS